MIMIAVFFKKCFKINYSTIIQFIKIFAIHTAAIVVKGLMVRFKLSNYMVKFT